MEEDNFIDNLIIKIEKNEVLYNKKHKLYYNRLYKQKIWQNIAKEIGKTVEECQGKWKQLRERFVKESRKYVPSGSGADYLELESQWPYTQNLKFLREFVQPRITRSNEYMDLSTSTSSSTSETNDCDNTIEFEDDSEHNISFSSGPSPKPTINSTLEAIEEAALAIKNQMSPSNSIVLSHSLDADESFCRTLLALLREMPPQAKDEARTKLFLCAMEIKKQYKQP